MTTISHQRSGTIYRVEYHPSANKKSKKQLEVIKAILTNKDGGGGVKPLVDVQLVANNKKQADFFTGDDLKAVRDFMESRNNAYRDKLHETTLESDFRRFKNSAWRPEELDLAWEYHQSKFKESLYRFVRKKKVEKINPQKFIQENRQYLPCWAKVKAFFHLI